MTRYPALSWRFNGRAFVTQSIGWFFDENKLKNVSKRLEMGYFKTRMKQSMALTPKFPVSAQLWSSKKP